MFFENLLKNQPTLVTMFIVFFVLLIFVVLPIVILLLYKFKYISPRLLSKKESFDENDKSAFFDSLLNSNAETQQLFLNMIDPETGTLKVDEIQLGTKKITAATFTSVSGTAKHNDNIPVPSGTTDDWSILVSPGKMGRGEPNSEQDNALLKFTCAATPTNDKKKWKIESTYKYRVQNVGNGTIYFDGVVNYLIVPK